MFGDSMDRTIEKVVRETILKTIQLRVTGANTNHQASASNSPSSFTLEQTYVADGRVVNAISMKRAQSRRVLRSTCGRTVMVQNVPTVVFPRSGPTPRTASRSAMGS